jgi:hypothetical protein
MIGTLNSDLWTRLSAVETCDLDQNEAPDLKGLFIDWVPKSGNEQTFIRQAALVEHYVKTGIPVVIFDRHLAIENKEYNWLKKFNVTFFEPCVNHRSGFEWCPQWIKPLEPDTISRDERSIDLAYEGDLTGKIKWFEKYYMTYASMFPKIKAVFNSDMVDFKVDEYKNHNLIQVKEIDFRDVTATVVIGSYKDYSIGHIWDNLFDIMSQGCVPLLPIEHRFFIGLFDHLVVRDERDMDYFISGTAKIRGVIIEEIYETALKRFPEFSIDFMMERLIRCLKI